MHPLTRDPLGIALIGVGMVSHTYMEALNSLSNRIKLKGVMGSRPTSGETFIKKYELDAHAIRNYKSVDEVSIDEDIDIVLLTTPPNARTEFVRALAATGKPILMEKPAERTLSAAIELCDICDRANVPFGIMLQHRARPSAVHLMKKVASENFGDLRVVEISVPWWRPQSYYDEPGRGSYNRDGGGVMISQAIHTMDLALQFTGPVHAVSAMSSTTEFHSMEAEDFVSANLHFTNGAVGNLMASTSCYPGRTESIYLHYTNVSVRLESNKLELSWHNGELEQIGESAASGAGADPMAFTSDWHKTMIENFIDVINGKAQPIASARSALPVHKLIDTLERSAKSGTTQPIEQS